MSDFSCSRRLFLVGTATTFAGAVLAACGSSAPTSLPASDVPVGSAVLIDAFIIAQPEPGIYKAYSNVCPHQGYKISKVDGQNVICPQHNSVFQLSDGACIAGPARSGMSPAKLSAQGEQLTVEK